MVCCRLSYIIKLCGGGYTPYVKQAEGKSQQLLFYFYIFLILDTTLTSICCDVYAEFKNSEVWPLGYKDDNNEGYE